MLLLTALHADPVCCVCRKPLFYVLYTLPGMDHDEDPLEPNDVLKDGATHVQYSSLEGRLQ